MINPSNIKPSDLSFMEMSLANDEASTNEELVEHFVSEGVPVEHAKAAVAVRNHFFTEPIVPDGFLYSLLIQGGATK